MGCASSGPLGKNLVDGAKETAGDVAHMGEGALHDLGEAAKGGMEHVKEAVESAVHTAEHGLGTMMGKIEDTIGHKKEHADNLTSDMKNAVEGFEASTEDTANRVHDGIVEELSEAETVLASEAEETKHAVLERTTAIKEMVAPTHSEDVKVEDIEEVADDAMGSAVMVDDSKKPVEELVAKMPTPPHTPPPEAKAEPPTLWELEADAILNRQLSSPALDVEPKVEAIQEEIVVEPESIAEEVQVDEKNKEEENAEEIEKDEELGKEEDEEVGKEEEGGKEEEKNEDDSDSDSIDPDLLEREEQMRRLHRIIESDLREELMG